MSSSPVAANGLMGRRWVRRALGTILVIAIAFTVSAAAGGIYRAARRWVGGADWFTPVDPNRPLVPTAAYLSEPGFRRICRRLVGRLETPDHRAFHFAFTVDRMVKGHWWRVLTRAVPGGECLYATHLVLVDEATRETRVAGRTHLAPADFGALADGLDLAFDSWRFAATEAVWSLSAGEDRARLDLEAGANRPPALLGAGGYWWRGRDLAPEYALARPQLSLAGTLRWDDDRWAVKGSGWWLAELTSYRAPTSTRGADYIALVLADGRLGFLAWPRLADGVAAPSPLTVIEPDGQVVTVGPDRYTIERADFHDGPKSGRRYPIAWNIHIDHYRADLTVRALAPDGEFRPPAGDRWRFEGPCGIEGTWGEWSAVGDAYAAVTGYAPASWW